MGGASKAPISSEEKKKQDTKKFYQTLIGKDAKPGVKKMVKKDLTLDNNIMSES